MLFPFQQSRRQAIHWNICLQCFYFCSRELGFLLHCSYRLPTGLSFGKRKARPDGAPIIRCSSEPDDKKTQSREESYDSRGAQVPEQLTARKVQRGNYDRHRLVYERSFPQAATKTTNSEYHPHFTLLMSKLIPAFLLALCLTACGKAQPPVGYKTLANIDYAATGQSRQCLDLYLPQTKPEKPLPLLIYIHGGGWEGGSKDQAGALFAFLQGGQFAGASIGYRLTDQASWPAQIHDCKAAIRWLRAHAAEYGYDAERMAVYGISAGGHLVSLLGLTSGVAELEGSIGKHLDQKSHVKCVMDFCGPTNFLTFFQGNSEIKAENPQGPISKLLGGVVSARQAEAKQASPETYVAPSAPPFLIIHGTADNLVPVAQARSFDAGLDKAGVSSTLLIAEGAPHVFFNAELVSKMKAFLDQQLLGKPADLKDQTLQGPWK
jgi:acetyl esterase/lipase